jgi:squalene cyclase
MHRTTALILSLTLLLLPPRPLCAEDESGADANANAGAVAIAELAPEAERAIDNGLQYLARAQNPDGSWPGQGEEGEPAYATSMAILILGVPYRFLPIYQR